MGTGAGGVPAAVEGEEADIEVTEGEDDEEGDGAPGAAGHEGESGAGGEVEAAGDFDEGEEADFLFEGAGLLFPGGGPGGASGAVLGGADEFGIFAAEETLEDGDGVNDADAHADGHEEGDQSQGPPLAAPDGFLRKHVEGTSGGGEEAAEAGDDHRGHFALGVEEVGINVPDGEEDEGEDDGGEIDGGVGEMEEGFELDAPREGGTEN